MPGRDRGAGDLRFLQGLRRFRVAGGNSLRELLPDFLCSFARLADAQVVIPEKGEQRDCHLGIFGIRQVVNPVLRIFRQEADDPGFQRMEDPFRRLELCRRIVIPGDEDEFAIPLREEPRDEVVVSLERALRGIGGVKNVACDEDGVDFFALHHGEEPFEKEAVLGIAGLVVQQFPEVPVGGVENFHAGRGRFRRAALSLSGSLFLSTLEFGRDPEKEPGGEKEREAR